MKGYNTASGYMGFVGDGYILFATEQDYREYMEDQLRAFMPVKFLICPASLLYCEKV